MGDGRVGDGRVGEGRVVGETSPAQSSDRVRRAVDRPAGFPRGPAPGSIFGRSLAERFWLVLVVGAGLLATGAMMGPLYATMADDLGELLAGLPEAMLTLFGDMSTAAGFINAEIYAIVAPGLLVYVAVTSAARAFAAEEEELSIGLLLANPISRRSVAVQKLAATAVHVGIVAAMTGLGVWVGVRLADLDVPVANIFAASAHLGLFGLVVGALAALLSVATGRRILSQAAAAVAALIAYAWASFAPLSATLEPFAVLSPWHWYFSSSPLVTGADPGYLAMLAALAAALAAAAIWLFDRRDLPG